MKNLLKLSVIFSLFLLSSSCTETSDELVVESESTTLNPPCIDADPKTRVVNNGTVDFNLEVFLSDGTTVVSILNIPPNSTTSWATFSEAEVMFSLKGSNLNVSDDKVLIQMDNCMAYEIEVDINNEIVSYTPTIL
ncbi:hypothetical protein HNV08_09360 [Winogradskyella eckloniae]|uniref:hypothetical protein n=1 Tax=Winogradskyella eckloniae TaxID=1089306 RepID=UPI00156597B7|nr:hypothetical protein [Winogradskyella eckloniae]NRD20255.1 hypothetical protein [Winogradskyella eckloniae]